ncbi:MAG: hypothetical protein QXE05_09905 [Nitrososphaeria archaeon]
MSQFNRLLDRIKEVLYEPLVKVILSYTKFFRDLMKVLFNINSYISRYYFPRIFAPKMGITTPIEGVREEAFEPLHELEVQPKISYTINLLRRIVARREATVPQQLIKSVEVPESLSEAYKIVGESTSYIMRVEKGVSQYTIGKQTSKEAARTEYIMKKETIEEELRPREEIVPEATRVSETKPSEETIATQIEAVKGKPYEKAITEKILEAKQEWSEPFKYISSLVNILTQLGGQLPVTRYFIPTQFTIPEEAFTKYYMFRPLMIGEKLESIDYRLIQSLYKSTFTEFSALEETILPPARETITYPLKEYKNILSIPYIISYFLPLTQAPIHQEAALSLSRIFYFLLLTQVPKLQEKLPKMFTYSLEEALHVTYPSIQAEVATETIRSALTSAPLTQYISLLAKEYPYYIKRAPLISYMLTLPYISLGVPSIIEKLYRQMGTEYPSVKEKLKMEDFTRKTLFTRILNILETLPTLAQETETIRYVGLEAYYPLSIISRNLLQNIIQVYDRLLYEVKVVRPSEPSPMTTAASQFLETSRIFRVAEEMARRETLPSTIRQPYTIQPTRPSQSLVEREIQNIFNITVPEGAEIDIWELERKITQILREQYRRYYGPIF